MQRRDAVPLDTVLKTLKKRHQPPRTFLAFRTPLDLLIATILSAQCTDARVNSVTSTILYPKYKTIHDYIKVSRRELEQDIHSCGTYRSKAKYIQELCKLLLKNHDGKVPGTLAELTALPGVGRKTAAVILWAIFKKNEGIAVDTHVLRVSRRLGLSDGKGPIPVERDLMAQTPSTEWGLLTTLLISHGRAICTARNRNCPACPFAKACPSSRVEGRTDLAKMASPRKSSPIRPRHK